MPLLQLVCPHCEESVEMQVTSVTRSRECPKCRKMIILQFTTKATGMKRKALLMPVHELGDDEGFVMVRTMPLEGRIQDRMRFDPEVRSSAKALIAGVIVMLMLICLAVAADQYDWWGRAANQASRFHDSVSSEDAGETTGTPAPLTTEGSMERPSLGEAGTPAPVISESKIAEDAAKAFLAAPNVEERLKLVKDRDLMESKIKAYYEKHPGGPIAFEFLDVARGAGEREGTHAFNVSLPKVGQRRLMMVKSTAGVYQADWASFVIYSEMEWKDFIEKRPVTPVLFRILANVDDYYNYAFSDDRRLGCIKLTNPLNPDDPTLYAYYSRSTPLGREMEFVMRQTFGQSSALILTLRFPENAASNNQVWVDERVAEGWMAKGR